MITVEQVEEVQKAVANQLIPGKSARALVNRFILENLKDGFCAGQPRLVVIGPDPAWSVPIVFGPSLAEIGEVLVQAVRAEILGFTPPSEVYRNARQLLS